MTQKRKKNTLLNCLINYYSCAGIKLSCECFWFDLLCNRGVVVRGVTNQKMDDINVNETQWMTESFHIRFIFCVTLYHHSFTK